MKTLTSKLTFFVLISAFLFQPSLPASASPFSDSAPYETAVDYLWQAGVVKGNDTIPPTVTPFQFLNRAEVAALFVRARSPESLRDYLTGCGFSDIFGHEWYAAPVCTAKALGYVDGNDDGSYAPERELKYIEFFKILIDAYNLPVSEIGGPWYVPYDALIRQYGLDSLLPGYTNPEATIIRGEVFELLYRFELNDKGIETFEQQAIEPPIQVPSNQTPSSTDLGDLTIDPSRIPQINAHHQIPVDTSGWTVVNYDGAKDGQNLYQFINSLSPNTIVQLPDGTYSGHLSLHKSDTVVRGNCSDPSAVTWSHSGNPSNLIYDSGTLCNAGWLSMCGADFGDSRSDIYDNPVSWTGSHSKGSTVLDVSDSSGFSPGDVVWLSSDVLPLENVDAQTDDQNFMAEIISVSSNQITLASSLPIDFSSSNATVTRFKKLLQNSGVECLTLEQADPQNAAGLYQMIPLSIHHAFNSWLYNVDIGDTFNTHALVQRSAKLALLSNRIGEQYKSLQGDGSSCGGDPANNPCWNKQAIVFDEAHENSFANNVVHASIGVELRHSASKNWIAYNYFPEPEFHSPNEPRRALFPHGNYSYANILEGNVFWGAGEMDAVWGSQGDYYTWFRNIALGPFGRFSTDVWADDPASSFYVSRFANYLLNRAPRFGITFGLDLRSFEMHLERNAYTEGDGFFVNQHGSAVGTTNLNNVPTSNVDQWSGLNFPDSLNQAIGSQSPAFWCSNTVSQGGEVCNFSVEDGGVGAMWDGSCKLPAQVRAEGLSCS